MSNADVAFVEAGARSAANKIQEVGELLGVPSKVREGAQKAYDDLFVLVDRARKILPGLNLEIAVVGRYSSGKSSLINALLQEKDLLPSAVRALTSIPTIVRFGNGLPQVILEPYGSKYRITQPDASALMEGTAFRTQSGAEKKLVLLRNGSMLASNSESDIRAVELLSSATLLKQIGALIDAPGWDSPEETHESHTNRAKKVAETAHALIVVTQETGLKEQDLLLLKEHLFALRTVGCPVALVINKSDTLEPEAAQTILMEARQRLREAFPLHARRIAVFAVSSLPVDQISRGIFSQMSALQAWIVKNGTASSLDTQAMLFALLGCIRSFGEVVQSWNIGDFELSWERGSLEAERFSQHLLKQATTGMTLFAAESVAKDLRSKPRQIYADGSVVETDIRVWRKLVSFGFKSPEEAARAACFNELTAMETSLRSQFVTHCRRSQADSDFAILHPKIYVLLTEPILQNESSSTKREIAKTLFMPSAYDTDLDDWLCATGANLDTASQKSILSNRWASKTDIQRISEMHTLSHRLRDALVEAGQSSPTEMTPGTGFQN